MIGEIEARRERYRHINLGRARDYVRLIGPSLNSFFGIKVGKEGEGGNMKREAL